MRSYINKKTLKWQKMSLGWSLTYTLNVELGHGPICYTAPGHQGAVDQFWLHFVELLHCPSLISPYSVWFVLGLLLPFPVIHKSNSLIRQRSQIWIHAHLLHDWSSEQTVASALCRPTDLELSSSGAYNQPPVFIPDTLLSIFNVAAAGVTSADSAWWEGERWKRAAVGRGVPENHPTVSFHCPLWMLLGSWEGPALKYYI